VLLISNITDSVLRSGRVNYFDVINEKRNLKATEHNNYENIAGVIEHVHEQ
jgi:hypothetical protein